LPFAVRRLPFVIFFGPQTANGLRVVFSQKLVFVEKSVCRLPLLLLYCCCADSSSILFVVLHHVSVVLCCIIEVLLLLLIIIMIVIIIFLNYTVCSKVYTVCTHIAVSHTEYLYIEV